ncbi:SGNH/GDSL hydrolase family protein [Maribacter sp. 2307ULW6-5]|uniref:SGNH/GDSL hydrolase family protein n=1 Tax=Maribacter sp. 2307ULW6-5 TaxID=3386275 RepID=UPI0039BD6AB9
MTQLKPLFSLLFLLALPYGSAAQEMVWHKIRASQVQGKMAPQTTETFKRLPGTMQEKVREPVWELSKNSAGLHIDFETNSPTVEVRYQVAGTLSFPHMPATGVSGVDLYLKGKNKEWQWVRGLYKFADTVSYRFQGMAPPKEKTNHHRLYLPLYNTVLWMEIGIAAGHSLQLVTDRDDRPPLVIYGTSIAQGACASRAGMGWTNILSRKLDRTVINLGFSGNGRLEPELIEAIAKVPSAAYVLDCMPNFTSGQGLGPKTAQERLIAAVRQIRKTRPNTPIIIAEHAGYADGQAQPGRKQIYLELNRATQEAIGMLRAEGVPGLYRLSKEELALDANSFVDGTHPNDHGMLNYAQAYWEKLQTLSFPD